MAVASTITVEHNVEVAHRLSCLPGKCENIHGHSMWVSLKIHGTVNSAGILDGRDFSDVKKAFRAYLDSTYDHHLLLNENDPWASAIGLANGSTQHLPGLQTFPGDPTVENLARWIGEWAEIQLEIRRGSVHLQETRTNGASYSWWRS